jgi:hypothetical protein
VGQEKETVQKYGAAILPGVLSPADCEAMKDGSWAYLEQVSAQFQPTPIRRDQPETYTQMQHLWPMHSMLLKFFGIGHASFMWALRQHPNVVAAFSRIWKDTKAENLLCSFDGASLQPAPPPKGRSGWFHAFGWHTDQNYMRSNQFECIQSWVTAYDVREGDATLAFLENSHLYHAEFAQVFATDVKKEGAKDDWFKLEAHHVKWYMEEKKCQPRCIQCAAGSMVFWDSRTIHCGIPPSKDRAQPNARCVAYLCMTPRLLCTDAMLKKRIQAFEALRTTSHWPHRLKMNAKTPRTYGKSLQTMTPVAAPSLQSIGRRLVGYSK